MKHARDDYNRIQDPAGLIPDNEPVFLIRGQDLAAPSVIRFWAMTAHANGASEEIVNAANRQANAMEAWQRNIARKTPDLPTPTDKEE